MQHPGNQPPDRLLRIADVVAQTGLSLQTIYRRAAEGSFPRQARVGRCAVWSGREVDEWIAAQLAARAA